MTDLTAADALVAEARRAVHESLTVFSAPEADRVRALIADLETAVEGRTALRMTAAVSVPPPADQTARRQRIAEALYTHNHPGWATRYSDLDQDERDTYLARADAVLAVLPEQTDRAAVLHDAAIVYAEILGNAPDHSADPRYWQAIRDVIVGLRRMAAEEQPAPCAECGHPKATHRDGDDPVTPGECSACPDDDARHDHRPAVGEKPAERARCPHCQLPHDLTPDSLPAAVCASTRQRIADAAQAHAVGDHSGCCRADCDVLQAADERQFGTPDCTCIPFTRQTDPPRILNRPTDTVDMISGWEIGRDCPHHKPAVGEQPETQEAP